MRRWTDGKSWSASRVAGSFLTYREMEGKRAVTDLPHQTSRAPGQSGDESDENQDSHETQKYEITESYKYKVDGLIKQSFSITTSEDQKLHLISYYGRSYPDNIHLRPPTQDPTLMHIQIPRGLYPESTLEVSIPVATGRSEESRYPVTHNTGPTVSAPSAGLPSGPTNYGPTHVLSGNYPDSAWDYRAGPSARPPREIRPAVYDGSGREHAQEHRPTGPHSYSQQPLHPQILQQQIHSHLQQQQHNAHQIQQQQQHHPSPAHRIQGQQIPPPTQTPHRVRHPSQNGHTQSQSHGPTQFHPYGHPISPRSEKQHGQDQSTPHYRSSIPLPTTPSNQSFAMSGSHHSIHEHRLIPGAQTSHQTPQAVNPQGPDGRRRQSLPRISDQVRKPSAGHAHGHSQGSGKTVVPLDANAAGQHIFLPDLNDVTPVPDHLKLPSCDIPPDRLGRWPEEARVLDLLRSVMKI